MVALLAFHISDKVNITTTESGSSQNIFSSFEHVHSGRKSEYFMCQSKSKFFYMEKTIIFMLYRDMLKSFSFHL